MLTVVFPDAYCVIRRFHAYPHGLIRRNAVKKGQHGGIRCFLDVLDDRERGFRAVVGELEQHQRVRLAFRSADGIGLQTDDQRDVPVLQRNLDLAWA